jgi:hypothetical protein
MGDGIKDVEEGVEAAPEDGKEAVIEHMIDRWQAVKDCVLVQGRIKKMTLRWELKRGEYQSDVEVQEFELEFDNLKCDFLVHNVSGSVALCEGDIGIVGDVYRKAQHYLGEKAHGVMLQHMNPQYEPKKVRKLQTKTRPVDGEIL